MSIGRFYHRVVRFLPVLLFGKRLAADDPAGYLQAHTYSLTRERLRKMPLLERVGTLALWPVATVLTTIYITYKNGGTVKRRTGVGILRQVADQLVLATTFGIAGVWYYIFELYRPGLRAQARCYLLRSHLKYDGVYRQLRHYTGSVGKRTLNDKLLFHHFCRNHDLSSVNTVCAVDPSGVEWLDGRNGRLPPCDLFAKPKQLRGGRGASIWEWRDGLYVETASGTPLRDEELLEHLSKVEGTGGYLLQERLVNHSNLADLNGGVLSTARVVVCFDEEWQAEVVHAYMRMSCREGAVVDNVHAGGVAAAVDLKSGRLGRATDLGGPGQFGWVDRHPVTGEPIEGFQVPNWDGICDLARRAHARLDEFCVAGWDIAILDGEPCLVEGNAAPCVDSTQRMLERPIGNGRFGELLAFHLRRAKAGLPPPRAGEAEECTELPAHGVQHANG